MHPLITSLTNVLSQEKECLSDISKLAEKKKDAILRNDIIALESVILEEKKEVLRLEKLENQRIFLSAQYAKELSKPDNNKDHPEQRLILYENENLKEIVKEIKSLLQNISKLNELNNILIRDSLAYIRFSLSLLAGSQSKIYDSTGQCKETRPFLLRLFDVQR